MIWTRESLEALSEEEFCKKVLIPLFRAMGYKDVRYLHGGVLVQGKDMVMWKSNDFGIRRNYAVVAKAERITGAATTLGNTVQLQIQQALGSTFLDDVTREEEQIHEVILANSHEVTKEADLGLRNALTAVHKNHLVQTVAGDRLWELLTEHLPQSLLFESLADAQRALKNLDPDWGYLVQLRPGTTQFILLPKSPDTPPLEVSFGPNFPDTPEGAEQRAVFERFLRTGESAAVRAEFVKVLGLPQSALDMLPDLNGAMLHVGPSMMSTPQTAALIIANPGEPERVVLPLLEFGRNQSGTEQLLLSNAQQPIPLKFELIMRRGEQPGRFRYDFTEAQSNAYTSWLAASVQAELAKGGMLVYVDLGTGFRYRMFEIHPGEVPSLDDDVVELWKKVADIQRRSRTLIPQPQRPFFSDDDIQDIISVEEIMASGSTSGKVVSLRVDIKVGFLRELLEKDETGQLGEYWAEKKQHFELILDTPVPLGRVVVHCSSARIAPEELEKVKEQLRSLPESDDDASIEFGIEPAEGHVFSLAFPDWPNGAV